MKQILSKLTLLFVLLISSCMDEDLSKISTSVNTDASYAIPLIHSTTNLLDLLPENENMVIESDNSIRIAYRQDSIAYVTNDSLLQIADQPPTNESFSIGAISLSTFNTQMQVQLSELTSNLSNPTLVNQINNGISYSELNGAAYFPPITPQSGGSYTAQGSDEFQSIFITNGEIQIQITNNLAVEINTLTLMLKNATDQSQLGTFLFNNIAVGDVGVSSIDLNGVFMYSDLELEIISISSLGSGSNPSDQSTWVPMLNSDELSINISGHNMIATSGLVKYPEQEGPSDSFDINLDLEDEVELSFIDLSEGDFVYTYSSDIQTTISLNLTIPQLVDDSNNSFTRTLSIEPSTEPVTITESIADYSFHLSSTPNFIEVIYTSLILATESYETYNQLDEIDLSIGLENLDFDFIEGYFGQKEQFIEEDILDIDVSDIDEIASGLVLESPVLRLTTNNSMNIPFEIDLDLVAQNGFNNVSLDGPPLQINPNAMSLSEFNNVNSQLSDFIALNPSEISYSGTVLSNPYGSTFNSISPSSSITINMEMDLPLHLRIEDAMRIDTLALDFGSDESTDYDIDFIESVKLKVHTENEFPLDVGVTIFFMDSISGLIQDSLTFDLLQAAQVDEQGATMGPHVYDSNVELDSDQIDALFNSNQALLDITLNSYDYENTAVRLYTDYQFIISAGVLLELKSED